jgi:hypothetical protein
MNLVMARHCACFADRETRGPGAADADVGQVAAKCGLNLSGSAARCRLWE